ncbi:MAG TPA: sortase [Anaerolineae bacterium]|nr:sortase [Anaerolineae bacterium]
MYQNSTDSIPYLLLCFLIGFGNLLSISAAPMDVNAEGDGLFLMEQQRAAYGAFDLARGEPSLGNSAGPFHSPRPVPKLQSHIWDQLANNGLNGSVFTLAAAGSDLYVGGEFTQTADGSVTNLRNIARFNTITNTWSPLTNNGLVGYVMEITVVGEDLYVGGSFNQTTDGAITDLGNIARYNLTTNTWFPLPNDGLNDDVLTIAMSGTDLYVGGSFSQTADGAVTNLGNIVRFDGANWSALPNNGLETYVSDIAVAGSDLYVVGIFNRTADTSVILNNIARYDISLNSWNALPNNGLNNSTWALAVVGSELYVGGSFTGTFDGTVDLNRIAKYDLAAHVWSPLANNGLNSVVYTMAATGEDLYVGGMFNQTVDGAVVSNWIARYNMSAGTWHPTSNGGLAGGTFYHVVNDLEVIGSDLYVGGDFTRTADASLTLNFVARYSPSPPASLPDTGFHPGVISSLPTQPDERAFSRYGEIWLAIPRLGIEVPIVGVPRVNGEWDVRWLGNQAGYLEGTAFPTWPGNTAITAHVWSANNSPGPFVDLKRLRYGDRLQIRAWGQVYTYEVRESYLASPGSLSPLRHEQYDWVSLITCERYSHLADNYVFRRIVRAVLLDVSSESAMTLKEWHKFDAVHTFQ